MMCCLPSRIPKRNLSTYGAKILTWRSSAQLNAYAPEHWTRLHTNEESCSMLLLSLHPLDRRSLPSYLRGEQPYHCRTMPVISRRTSQYSIAMLRPCWSWMWLYTLQKGTGRCSQNSTLSATLPPRGTYSARHT